MPDAIISELSALGSWLADFPGEAMIELDYAGIVDLFAEADLILDDSAAEVWEALGIPLEAQPELEALTGAKGVALRARPSGPR